MADENMAKQMPYTARTTLSDQDYARLYINTIKRNQNQPKKIEKHSS